MKQIEYFDIKQIKKILKREKSKKIFLVTGKKSFDLSLAKEKINEILKNVKLNVKKFSDFSPNPKIKEIEKGLKKFKKDNYDIIIAVGGGSTIDVAKSIKLFSKKNIPLVAIPTTSGSGSESTYFIVYYEGKNKISEGNADCTLPNYIILDYNLIKSLPNGIMASSGIDALGQAIESYWSIHSTKKSRRYAKIAIKLIKKYLESAIKNKDNKSLKKLIKGTNYAGKSINIAKTTACHSLAYPMTSYFNVPHGHAVGLSLSEMMKFNSGVSNKDCLDNRGFKFAKKRISEIIKLIDYNEITLLMKNIGLKTKLSDIGLKKKDLNIIVKKGFNPKRVKNNPRNLKPKDILKILKNIY